MLLNSMAHMLQVTHPIHDQTLFLNERHKKQLKEEFGVEPWTFEQYLGEAVFIPAGCPHQVRNKQAIINVGGESLNAMTIEHFILRLLHHLKSVFELLQEQLWYRPNPGVYVKLIVMLGKCKQLHQC